MPEEENLDATSKN